MIKVNLLNNQSQSGEGVTEFDIRNDFNDGNGSNRDLLVKVLVLFLPLALLLVFESQSISELRGQLQGLNSQKSTLQAQVAQQGAVATKAEAMQLQIKDLERKIGIVRNLSKVRLRELKAFDTLQNIIPEKVWLTGINYEDNLMRIKGSALSDEDLTSFVETMEERADFSDVILLRSVEKKNSTGTIKEFLINSGLGQAG